MEYNEIVGVVLDDPLLSNNRLVLDQLLPRHQIIRGPQREAVSLPYWRNMIRVRQDLVKNLTSDTVAFNEEDELFHNFFTNYLSQLHELAVGNSDESDVYLGRSKLEPWGGSYRTQRAVTQQNKISAEKQINRLRERGFEIVYDENEFDEDDFIKSELVLLRPSDDYTEIYLYGHAVLHPPVVVDQKGQLQAPTDEQYGVVRKKYIGLMADSIRSILTNQDVDTLGELAKFIRNGSILHPFVSVNFSLIMNIVNHVLELKGMNTVDHGYLDLIATRVNESNFIEVFKEHYENREQENYR